MAGTQRFLAASVKEVKKRRSSQSIYFVTGGVFERDEEEDAEEARKKGKTLLSGLEFQFFSSLAKCLRSMFHADVAADVCQDTAC